MGKYNNEEIAKKSHELLTEDKKELKQQTLKHTERQRKKVQRSLNKMIHDKQRQSNNK